ncbi:unnamed protein product [Microthlaspi erraticum]|uniref:Uncharacterized protein n=1 Tax=Microthlaspi erraticum TaxID=1685480 RepID=A0A6D2IWP0_9BRAS|nr:unnamed protein product [Microthlaspi erraticum]CAA7029873.1 unnamed protein product [Microthlaspi erraticum]
MASSILRSPNLNSPSFGVPSIPALSYSHSPFSSLHFRSFHHHRSVSISAAGKLRVSCSLSDSSPFPTHSPRAWVVKMLNSVLKMPEGIRFSSSVKHPVVGLELEHTFTQRQLSEGTPVNSNHTFAATVSNLKR